MIQPNENSAAAFLHVRRGGRAGAARGIIIGAILVLILVALVGRRLGWFSGGGAAGMPGAAAAGGGPPQMPPMPVDVAPAEIGRIVDEVRATGRIEAQHTVQLKAEEQGRITELLFQEGKAVQAGAPLVKLDDALLKAQREKAAADQNLAQQQLDRMRKLRAGDASTPADVERAEAASRSTKASLDLLDIQIARAVVRAPFTGVVGQRFVSPGDYVTPATPLLVLQTTNPQFAVVEVPERHAAELRNGQTIEFTVAAYPHRTFRAQVEFIDPEVQLEGRSIVVKAAAPNADGALKPGMFIEARLATATRPNAVIVREDAIQPLRTSNVVWVVADGKAARRVVQLGSRSSGQVEVLSGVKVGEQVVVGGLERMAEGMAVMPRGASPDSAVAAPPAAPGKAPDTSALKKGG